MVRATNAPAAKARRKKLLKKCKGYFGDRKNHLRQSKNALMTALSYNYAHRKLKKRDFRALWITRIGAAAKIHGISYSKFMNGLKKQGCEINRKSLSELAIADPQAFAAIVEQARQGLVS